MLAEKLEHLARIFEGHCLSGLPMKETRARAFSKELQDCISQAAALSHNGYPADTGEVAKEHQAHAVNQIALNYMEANASLGRIRAGTQLARTMVEADSAVAVVIQALQDEAETGLQINLGPLTENQT